MELIFRMEHDLVKEFEDLIRGETENSQEKVNKVISIFKICFPKNPKI